MSNIKIITSWSTEQSTPNEVEIDNNPKTGVVLSSLRVSQTRDFGVTEDLDTSKARKAIEFNTNLYSWNNLTNLMSDDIFNNDFFEAIVDLGVDAVPLIKKELETNGPSMIVHALDRILPNTVVPNSYLPLPILCNLWLDTLNQM